jgi:hypothetical protein
MNDFIFFGLPQAAKKELTTHWCEIEILKKINLNQKKLLRKMQMF